MWKAFSQLKFERQLRASLNLFLALFTNVMFLFSIELARDALNSEGYTVIGAYLSPVNDAYKKKVYSIFYYVR